MHRVLVFLDANGGLQVRSTSSEVEIVILAEAGLDAGATVSLNETAYAATAVLAGLPRVDEVGVNAAFQSLAPQLQALSIAADQSMQARAQFRALAREMAKQSEGASKG